MPLISKNYSGIKFGKWTAIKRDLKKFRPIHYECQCECGTLKSIPLQNLKRGLSTQCVICSAIKKSQDLIGKRFGFLQILKVEKHKGKSRLYVKCDCGIERFMKRQRILQQKSISCGLCNIAKKKAKYIKRYFDVGAKFGWLKILKKIDDKTVECKCKCGNIIPRKIYHLQTKNPSCGCFRKKISENLSKERSGEKNVNAKLRNLEVSSLKLLHKSGQYEPKELAQIFNIKYDACMAILRGDTWNNIE